MFQKKSQEVILLRDQSSFKVLFHPWTFFDELKYPFTAISYLALANIKNDKCAALRLSELMTWRNQEAEKCIVKMATVHAVFSFQVAKCLCCSVLCCKNCSNGPIHGSTWWVTCQWTSSLRLLPIPLTRSSITDTEESLCSHRVHQPLISANNPGVHWILGGWYKNAYISVNIIHICIYT